MALKSDPSAPFAPQPVLRPRAQVEDQLKEGILNGSFATGARLPSETALAESFAVSRTTIREALRSLAAAGLITKVSGKGGGSFVNTVDHHALGSTLHDSVTAVMQLGRIDYEEVTEVRRILEIPATRLASKKRSAEHLEHLHEVLDRQRTLDMDDPAVPTLDADFHGTIAEASGNRMLSSLVRGLHGATHPALTDLTPKIAQDTFRQHVAIVKAIDSKDPVAAEKAMAKHLDYVEQHYRS